MEDPRASNDPTIRRVRHEMMRRELTVSAVERITPAMVRVTLSGASLASFASASPDDHLKVFVPGADGEPVGRDYTPRHFDTEAGALVIDFVDHDAGPAAAWARTARAGDTVLVGGPRGSAVIEGDAIARWLLIGDETALPAIGRRIEEFGPGTPVTSLVAVAGPAEEQTFATAARLTARWLHRDPGAAADPAPYLAALETMEIAHDTFVWVAAEAEVARAIRRHILERGHRKTWMKASGYWAAGRADGAVKNLEDAA
ncbi:siderophore-interacting protein [Acuticoccus sp. I52.16.1]|uniref:siderophore-interacting protein n=1 Tax=Acuticoccus sp. I52.16.1 TaxID=2928472 RepID=UPI001FD44346|nr:siderophore-interacting protein [Acuticoccus sp. I52.16.1]UOM32724.1 siderophore-interacting protein [Acuticoccus sp. I52.16.1]